MKIIGVIPARYKSSRFPGKPLADICGKPMIWWVYQQASKVKDFEAVYVATDDDRIFEECKKLDVDVNKNIYAYMLVPIEVKKANKIDLLIVIRGIKYTINLK